MGRAPRKVTLASRGSPLAVAQAELVANRVRNAYPSLEIETGPPELALSAGLVLLSLAPFAGRAARMGVAHA